MSRIHGNRSGVGSRLSCLFTGVVTFGAVTIAMADDAIYSNDFTPYDFKLFLDFCATPFGTATK